MKNLTDREKNIVLATINLWKINSKTGFVSDYELLKPSFDLSVEEKRDIRDLVQVEKYKLLKNDKPLIYGE